MRAGLLRDKMWVWPRRYAEDESPISGERPDVDFRNVQEYSCEVRHKADSHTLDGGMVETYTDTVEVRCRRYVTVRVDWGIELRTDVEGSVRYRVVSVDHRTLSDMLIITAVREDDIRETRRAVPPTRRAEPVNPYLSEDE